MTRTTWLGITLGIVDALLSSSQHLPLLSKAAIFEAFSGVANILNFAVSRNLVSLGAGARRDPRIS
jgi:hypothetical protein